MAVYQDDGTTYREDGTRVERVERVRRGRSGSFLLGLLLVLAVIVAILFATGFWRADSIGVKDSGNN